MGAARLNDIGGRSTEVVPRGGFRAIERTDSHVGWHMVDDLRCRWSVGERAIRCAHCQLHSPKGIGPGQLAPFSCGRAQSPQVAERLMKAHAWKA